MPNPPLYYIEDELEPDVDMGAGDTAGRYGGNICGELPSSNVFGRHTLFVVDAVPVPARTSAANGQDSVVIFHRTELNAAVFLHFLQSSLFSGDQMHAAD